MKNILIACGVVFPDIVFESESQKIIPEILYDNRTDDITSYINQVFDYWTERRHGEPSKLSSDDVKEIVNFLRADFSFIPTLAERLDQVEKRLIRLTNEQAQVMNALSMNSHLLIEGNAGTGKTLLAVDFAQKRAEKGDRVLYLTYNRNLANSINRQIGQNKNLKVINIHALFGEYVPVDVSMIKKNPNKYFLDILPEAFLDYISSLPEEEVHELQYDILIMDEAQDILRPLYLHSLDVLLKDGLEKGEWTIFYDEKQNIYNPEYADGIDIITSYFCTSITFAN